MRSEEMASRLEHIRQRLYRTALAFLGSEAAALDAVDEAVYRALCSLKKLRHDEYFETWITRILINICKDELRKSARLRPLDELGELSAEDYDALPVREAVAALPVELRELIMLRFFMRFTLAESAETLGIPQGTAASRERRALKLLRLELSEEGEL